MARTTLALLAIGGILAGAGVALALEWANERLRAAKAVYDVLTGDHHAD